MNSTAAIKGFTGAHGGTVCTSSNAERALRWAFERGREGAVPARPAPGPQHGGAANSACPCPTACVFDPHRPGGGLTADQLRAATMILWRGHCSVHGRFTPENVDEVRDRIPDVNILVHPECRHEVVEKADVVGSTEMHHPDARRRADRVVVGGRYRAEPGPPPRRPASRQADRVPREDGLLLLDDEPHRSAAPGLVIGIARARAGRQSDRRRRDSRRERTNSARPHARVALSRLAGPAFGPPTRWTTRLPSEM